MTNKVVLIKETSKKIFISDDFVSTPKSIISTSLFNVKHRDENLNIDKKDYLGHKVFKLTGKSLNTGIDLLLVTSILIELHEKGLTSITLPISKFYERVDPEREQLQNNNGAFINRLIESSKRLMSLKMEIISRNDVWMSCYLFPMVTIDAMEKTIKVSMLDEFYKIFEIDRNAIYQVDFKILNKLSKEYSKVLYLYYISNNANMINKFSVEMLKDRLLCQNVPDKKFNSNVSIAHQELKDVGFLKYAEKVKLSREVTHYEVSTKTNTKILKNNKETEENKEVEIKKEEVKETVVVEEVKSKRPDFKVLKEIEELNKISTQMDLFRNEFEKSRNGEF